MSPLAGGFPGAGNAGFPGGAGNAGFPGGAGNAGFPGAGNAGGFGPGGAGSGAFGGAGATGGAGAGAGACGGAGSISGPSSIGSGLISAVNSNSITLTDGTVITFNNCTKVQGTPRIGGRVNWNGYNKAPGRNVAKSLTCS
jgi:hypothetical protein